MNKTLFPGLEVYQTGIDLNDFFTKTIESKGYTTIDEDWDKKDYLQFDQTSDRQSSQVVIDAISKYIDQYMDKYEVNSIHGHDAFYFIKYKPSGFFKKHADDDGYGRRLISFVYYINDNYEGGEIEFHHFDLKVKPKAGELYVFPTNYPFVHTAHPITSGEKNIIIGFLSKYKNSEFEYREYEKDRINYRWGL